MKGYDETMAEGQLRPTEGRAPRGMPWLPPAKVLARAPMPAACINSKTAR